MLGYLPSAPPDLVARRELRCRADTKFVLPPAEAAALLPALAADYAVLAVGAGFVARYRTLYFDTAALDCFHAQRRGRRVRQKVRIRHYPDRAVTLLEVKQRLNELRTTKVSRGRAYADNELTAGDQAFVALHTGLGQDVLPQVWTEYRRVTLLGLRANERVTIDLDLAVGAGCRSRSVRAVAIVEVKQWPFSRATPVMAALRARGWRPSSVSKYCTAIALTRPDVRHNRLLPDLRLLASVAE